MRIYGAVQLCFWADAHTVQLSDQGKLLAIYLLTGSHSNMLGCFRLPDGYITEVDDWDVIIDTNIKGLLYVTRSILPNMIKRNSGHIINIGSVAGNDYYMGGNVYSASKHAVKTLTRSLRIDLKGYRIRVSEIDPGLIKTEFSEVRWNKEKSEKFYGGFHPLVANDIADTVIYCTTRPLHVNISEIMVYPTDQVAPTIVHREGDSVATIFD